MRQDLFRRDFTINAMAVSLQGRGLRPARGLLRRAARPRRRRRPRAPQPLVHRRSDADLPRDPLREPLRLPDGRPHARSRAPASRWTSSASCRRARLRDELQALLSRGATWATPSLRPRRARRRPRDPSASRRRRGGRAPDRGESTPSARRVRARGSRLAAPARRARSAARLRRAASSGSSGCSSAAATPSGSPTRSRSRPRLVRAGRDDGRGCRRICALVEPHDPDGALLALAAGARAVPGSGSRATSRSCGTSAWRSRGGDLAELGLGESPRVGEILDELLRRKLNGELDGRAAEIDAARGASLQNGGGVSVRLFEWRAPGPYRVAFSTRLGGVSEGRTRR